MKKVMFIGNDFEVVEAIVKMKELFDFVPIIFVSKSVGDKVSINPLSQNVDINKIKNEKPEKLIESFDEILVFGEVDEVISPYFSAYKVRNSGVEETPKEVPNISIKFNTYVSKGAALEFIFKMVQVLKSMGIKVFANTDVKSFKYPISLIKKEENPDFILTFTLQGNADYTTDVMHDVKPSVYKIVNSITARFKKHVTKKQFFERDLPLFNEEDKHNIHIFKLNGFNYIFRSCNRNGQRLGDGTYRVYQAYANENSKYLKQVTYEDLFDFSRFRYYERRKAEMFATLFTFKYIKIENINDIILSYLGARKCNMACEYCFSDHKLEELPPLKKDEVVRIANYIIDGNLDAKVHVDNYIGGEPCLDFETVKEMYYTLLNYHKAYGIDASFGYLTNGMALTKKQLEWLKDVVPYVGFSLDGDKATNDAVRHNEAGMGSYQYVMDGIKMMKELNWPVETGVSCVITANNVNVKDIFLHFFDELGIRNVTIKPVRAPETSPIALTTKNFDKLEAGYKELFDFVYEKAKVGDTSYLKAMLTPLDYAGRFFIRVFLEDRVVVKRCGSAEHIFSVGNDACIYGCDSFNGTERAFIADTRNGVFSDKYKVPFVTDESEYLNCKKCWARFLCGGVCQYVQYVNGYQKNAVTEFECMFAKFMIEESIKFWTKAREEFAPETLEEIRDHILKIGFKNYRNRDSFFYAPC